MEEGETDNTVHSLQCLCTQQVECTMYKCIIIHAHRNNAAVTYIRIHDCIYVHVYTCMYMYIFLIQCHSCTCTCTCTCSSL